MKINIAKSTGFCFGVKRAIQIAFETIELEPTIEMLGDIVHNEYVVKEISKSGIRKIERLTQGKNKALLIRAHGAPIKTFQRALSLGYKIIDATCPMVKEIHRRVKDLEQASYKIIIIGDKRHEEVRGIVGQLKGKPIVIDNVKRIPLKNIKRIGKAAVVAQSTQDMQKVLKIAGFLKRQNKEITFFNTVCRPTRTKQKEIREMPLKNDVMIIIGSKASANTKRLYQISKSLNKLTYWIQSKRDIRPGWFKRVNSVGISAGASTPDSTTKEVITYISKIT